MEVGEPLQVPNVDTGVSGERIDGGEHQPADVAPPAQTVNAAPGTQPADAAPPAQQRRRHSDVFGPAPEKRGRKKKQANVLVPSEYATFFRHVRTCLKKKAPVNREFLKKNYPHLDDHAREREIRRAKLQFNRKQMMEGIDTVEVPRSALLHLQVESELSRQKLRQLRDQRKQLLDAIKSVLGPAWDATKSIEDMCGALVHYVNDLKKTQSDLQEKLEALTTHVVQIEEQEIRIEEERKRAQDALTKTSSDLNRLAAAKKEIANRKRKIADLEKEVARLTGLNADATRQKTDVEKELAHVKTQFVELRKQYDVVLSNLTKSMRKTEFAEKQLKLELATKAKVVVHKDEQLELVLAAKDELELQVQDLTQAASDLKNQRYTAEQTMASMAEELQARTAELTVFTTCTLVEKWLSEHKMAFKRALGNLNAYERVFPNVTAESCKSHAVEKSITGGILTFMCTVQRSFGSPSCFSKLPGSAART
jgi:predicted  nucleic acid-binding Zn-ribbon protein